MGPQQSAAPIALRNHPDSIMGTRPHTAVARSVAHVIGSSVAHVIGSAYVIGSSCHRLIGSSARRPLFMGRAGQFRTPSSIYPLFTQPNNQSYTVHYQLLKQWNFVNLLINLLTNQKMMNIYYVFNASNYHVFTGSKEECIAFKGNDKTLTIMDHATWCFCND